jgi:hypothetical protein
MWRGPLDGKGYGLWSVKTTKGWRFQFAHRMVYVLITKRAIRKGWTLDHECHNRDLTCPGGSTCPHRACVRPSHLKPKPQRDNLLASRHTMPAKHKLKTHCPAKHAYDEKNTYVDPKGSRHCRKCRSRRVGVIKKRQRAERKLQSG